MTTKKKKEEKRSFEDSVRRLEEIVEALEEGTVSLEDALALYEEGITLSKECGEKIKAAELRIRTLSRKAPTADDE